MMLRKRNIFSEGEFVKGEYEQLRCLLIAGVHPDLTSASSGNTALHAAIEVEIYILTSPAPLAATQLFTPPLR
jgi:hypothetical protein